MQSNLASVAVIIPALNAARTLSHALQSLVEQSIAAEAILVDGGSHDNTLAIASQLSSLRVVPAPGTSIYEAINRGLQETRAPAVCLVNADDALLPGALEALTSALTRNPQAGIARGWPRFLEMDGRGAHAPRLDADRYASQPLSLELLLRGPCAINSLCIRRDVFARIGLFDTSLRLAADRDWMLRAHCAGIEISEINQPVYRYLIHAGSSTLDRARRNYALIRREHLAIAACHLANVAQGSAGTIAPSTVVALKRWHAAESAMLCRHLFLHRKWGEAGVVARRAFSADPYWPAALIKDVLFRSTRGRVPSTAS